jgi:hypothetical protein
MYLPSCSFSAAVTQKVCLNKSVRSSPSAVTYSKPYLEYVLNPNFPIKKLLLTSKSFMSLNRTDRSKTIGQLNESSSVSFISG